MALTKVTGQVIKNTTDVTVGVLTVTNTLAVGGTVSIGGTLTYEDVTNIDSVGLITARNGIVVGSGITLSKDGDGFFTGVITATSYSGIDLSDVTGATGDFSIADKIVHTGDTNTALRFPAADTVTAETGGSERIRIDSSGRALLGPGAVATPKASTSGLDVSSGLYSIIMGGETNVGTGDGRRDGYQKESRLGMPHFTVAEEPVGLIYGVTLSGENRLYFGGGSSILNAATSISFHTAPSATTTAGTERLKVEAAGNVNFANNVNVSGTSTVSGIAQFANTINLTHASAGQNYIYFNEDIQLAKNGTGTRLKIDSDGRVLIGQTSSVNGIYGSPPPRFSVSTTTASPAIFATYSNDVYGSRIDLIKSRATTVGGTTVVQAGDAIGEIIFGGADGDQFHPTALIQSVVEAGVGNNDMPGDLRFYTNGGTTTATERVRINSAGIMTKPYIPSFSAKGSTDAIVAQSPLPFDSTGGINHNNGNHYSTTTYKFTCPVTGYYYVTCHVVPTDFSTGNNVELYVKDNSGNRHFLDRKVKTSNYSSNNFSVGGSRIIYQAATSTMWVEFNGIAGSPTLEGSSHFGITLIG